MYKKFCKREKMPINPCQKKFITPVEFEALFSVGTDAQSIWRSKGILPYIKLGGRKVLYDRKMDSQTRSSWRSSAVYFRY